MEILCFFAGIAFVYSKFYPLLFLFVILFFRPRIIYILWFCLAIGWAIVHQWYTLGSNVSEQILSNATIEGYVASIPVKNGKGAQFQFSMTTLNKKPATGEVLLSCFSHCPQFNAGDFWQLRAKLKRPRNLGNPGSFDFVSWLSAKHISWTGSIYSSSLVFNPYKKAYPILRLREKLGTNLSALSFDAKALGVLQALTLGLTHFMEKEEWNLFRRTGTIHLMVISGAHIGLIAGLTCLLFKWIWCFFPQLALRIPAQKIGSIGGILFATVYTLLAGFGVPAQRALVVCCFMLGRNFFRKRYTAWQAWLYALFCVLVFEPHSISQPGFYLSFLAVAILILINQRFSSKGIKQIILLQAACLFGLIPLTLFWFSYGAINGLVANLIAVPWVSFLIIPLALFVALTSGFFVIPGSVSILKITTSLLLWFLNSVDNFQAINLHFPLCHFHSSLSLMLGLALLIFLPIKNIIPAPIILLVAGLFKAAPTIQYGNAQVDVLDVGQGLAVVVRTASHTLIYDTGMKFYQGSDMGKQVIIPYLNVLGVNAVDKVVISHPDLDHRGGLSSLEENLNVRELIVNDPEFYHRGWQCHDYKPWIWEGVKFTFLSIHPLLKGKNNNSCILRISSPGGAVLLTGDIEKEAEQFLIKTYGKKLHSDVLVVPHHGSKTSSSPTFIRKISPRYALFSYGFDNRYHFPHTNTVTTYTQQKSEILNTADLGMISVVLKPDSYRVSHFNN